MTDMQPTEHLEHAIAEQQVRAVMAEYPHLSIVAEFYRGAGQDRDEVSNPVADAWFVLVRPTSLDVCVSACGPTPLGWDLIGRAVTADYPRRTDQPTQVDLTALGDSRFYVELVAAIRGKVAVIEEAKSAA